MNEQTMNEVRVITYSGGLIAYTDHLDDERAAWEDFTEAVTELLPGQIAQLIVDDLIVAEHDPERHARPLDTKSWHKIGLDAGVAGGLQWCQQRKRNGRTPR